jgi:hypothetical protein
MNYQEIYDKFIANRKAKEPECFRGKSKAARQKYKHLADGAYEHHHIKPKYCGGKDTADNIISLTPGDHFFAHLCYAKATNDDLAWRAVWAMAKMDASTNKNRSGIYAKRAWVNKAREKMRTRLSENTKLQHKDPAYIEKLHNPSVQAKRSETMKSHLEKNPSHLLKMREATKTESAKKNYSRAMKKFWQENREHMLANNQWVNGVNPMYDPIAREKVSKASKAYHNRPDVIEQKRLRFSGENNPTKRPEVAAKISAACKNRDMSATNGRNRAVINLDTGETFHNVSAAAKFCGSTHVSAACSGKRPRAGGYRWAYA